MSSEATVESLKLESISLTEEKSIIAPTVEIVESYEISANELLIDAGRGIFFNISNC